LTIVDWRLWIFDLTERLSNIHSPVQEASTRNPRKKVIMWSLLTAEALSTAEAAEMGAAKTSRNTFQFPVLAFQSKSLSELSGSQCFSGKPSVQITPNFGFRDQSSIGKQGEFPRIRNPLGGLH